MNAVALESAPTIRRWNACRPGAADAQVAIRSPRLPRRDAAPITRRCPWLRAAWACGPALLATDSQERTTAAGHPFRRQSVVLDTPFPHNILSLTPIMPTNVSGRYSPHPPGILCTSYTVKCRAGAICGRMIPLDQSSTMRGSRFDCTARCAPSRFSSLRCGPPLPLLTALSSANGLAPMAPRRGNSLPEDFCRDMKYSHRGIGDRHANEH